MDDLEFRRKIMAEPNHLSKEMIKAISEDPSKEKFLNDAKELNAKIESATQIDVPDDLANKLLLRQAMENEDEHAEIIESVKETVAANDGKYWQIAAAACFAFIFGLTINMSFLQPGNSLHAGEYALNYASQDLIIDSDTDHRLPLGAVNAKLASYGIQMEQEFGDVYYADSYFCNLNNVQVLKLVVKGQQGNISMFVLPKENRLQDWDDFGNGRFNGKATRYSKADMVIVGEKDEPLKSFQSKVENSMRWMI